MNIVHFKLYNYTIIKPIDYTNRDIGYSTINNCKIVGRNNFNPNILLHSDNTLISPYDEKIMSLNKDSFYDNNTYEVTKDELSRASSIILDPVFFFIYNFDNYYHFLYDTLPYLYTYLQLKKQYPYIKLLVNYPNKFKQEFYRFNIDFMEKLIKLEDMIIHNEINNYSTIFVSSSLTHGGYSNNPPRSEIYEVYNIINTNIQLTNDILKNKYIYISRRTWINNDKTNIGTDYTTRRKMINEDELVERLVKLGFVEIFAENLTTDEKIYMFSNAEIVIGSIGGGMANLLFCGKTTKSIIIVTPYFLDINYRFKYSLENSDYNYFTEVKTYKQYNNIPLFCRVKLNTINRIGEIIEYNYVDDKYLVNISENDIAGFNNSINYRSEWFNESEFSLIDNGLNSPYIVNIDNLIGLIKNIL